MTNVLAPSRNAYGLPVQDKYGRYKVGGPLEGHAGQLDKALEFVPGIGDYRAIQRGLELASQTQIEPDLMGGAKVTAPRANEAAFEIGTALPVMGDVATLAKLSLIHI